MTSSFRRGLLACCLLVAACSSGDADTEVTRSPSESGSATSRTSTGDSGSSTTTSEEEPGSSSSTTAGGPAGTPVVTVEVVDVVARRADAFTQGLELHDGVLYESTGRVGQSEVAAIDPDSGEVLRSADSPGRVFGEGLTRVGDRLIQLTWQDGVAFVYDLATFEIAGEYTYDGEGWGLCFDGDRLVMSDGSSELTFRDAGSFAETGSVTVELDGAPVTQLNELECVGDRVYANVWHSDTIMEIDSRSGSVTRVVDASALRARLDPPPSDGEAVLNGIAHDADAGTFWLTGKLWPQLFEVRFG